jgi:hypothetical protein
VHKYIALQLAGKSWVPEDYLLPEDMGYLKSWASWHDTLVEETVATEYRLFCDCYNFEGTLDWLGKLRGDDYLTVLDWKTPVVEHKTWACQCSAYEHLVSHHAKFRKKVKRVGSLMLAPDGSFAMMREYTDKKALHFNAFISALNVHRYFYGGSA